MKNIPSACDCHFGEDGSGRPHFSPNGKRIEFESSRLGYSETWAFDSDDTHCGQLTSLHEVADSFRDLGGYLYFRQHKNDDVRFARWRDGLLNPRGVERGIAPNNPVGIPVARGFCEFGAFRIQKLLPRCEACR